MPMMSFILKPRQTRKRKSWITPITDRWPYEGKREKRRLKEMSTTRVLHDAEWKLDDGASSRSSTKRNSSARDASDTTLCCALIGYINIAGQRKPHPANQRSRILLPLKPRPAWVARDIFVLPDFPLPCENGIFYKWLKKGWYLKWMNLVFFFWLL